MYLWAINALTLMAFGWDKVRAGRRKRRIAERRLLLLAALGGSPCAVLGRWIFRHKTRKRGFSVWLFGIFAAQLCTTYLALSNGLERLL